MKRLAPTLLLTVGLFLAGCAKPVYKYSDFDPTPTATVAGDTMTILAPSVPDPHLTQIAFTLMGVVVLP